MPDRPKNEKKKSGPGPTGPILFQTSSSSAGSTSSTNTSARIVRQEPIQESDFLTGKHAKVPPRPGFLPTKADIDLKKYPHMRFPHGQVAPAYAKGYVQSWQMQDEKFRQKSAHHPNESLMSIHNRAEASEHWELSAGRLPHRHFATCVTPDFRFQQKSLISGSNGICLTLCFAFMIYRSRGMECKQIFTTFKAHADLLGKIQNTILERSKVSGFHLLYSHQSAAYSFNYGIAEALLNKDLPAPATQQTAGATPKTALKSLPYLPPVGHFAVHPMLGSINAQVSLAVVKLPSGAFRARPDPHAQWSAQGLTASWQVPRMAEFVPQMRDDKSPPDEDGRDKMLHPQIGAHLFAGMQRSLRKSRADGKVILASPYFLITSKPGVKGTGHAILVEFNTSHGQIKTPRGIFDPNFGWVVLGEDTCSLDFELMLSGIYYMYQTPPPPGSMDFAGALIAYQLLHVVDA